MFPLYIMNMNMTIILFCGNNSGAEHSLGHNVAYLPIPGGGAGGNTSASRAEFLFT